ncbi:MAG: nuclear transport factor 2 family protein [Bryobacteraceae bacterium]
MAASNGPKVEKEILAIMETYKEAMIHNDTATLDKLLSDDLVFTHSHGEFQNKAQVLKSETGPPHIMRMEFSNTTVKIYGNTALVKGRVDLWHSDSVVHMDILHVWVRGSKGWQLVARQATLLAK